MTVSGVGGIISILARLDNFRMAVAAYQQAISNWANAHIVLPQQLTVLPSRTKEIYDC
jgi:hypothetical protein